MKPIQPKEAMKDLSFPVKGLDLSQGFGMQQPNTTPVGTNVRAFETFTARARGGSRPGLLKYVPAIVPGGSLIQELATVVGVGYNPPGPTGGPYVVQGYQGQSQTGSSTTFTFPYPVTAGNKILVAMGSTGVSVNSITDTAGNSYTQFELSTVSGVETALWSATATTGGFTTITCNLPSSATFTIIPFEIGSATQDVTNTGSGVNTFGSATLPTTTGAPGFGVWVVQANYPITSVSGGWMQAGSGTNCAAYVLPLSSIGVPPAIGWTFGAYTYWTSCGVTYR